MKKHDLSTPLSRIELLEAENAKLRMLVDIQHEVINAERKLHAVQLETSDQHRREYFQKYFSTLKEISVIPLTANSKSTARRKNG